MTPGLGSDVTTTSAAGSSRRPALLCIPSLSRNLLPRATAAAIEEETGEEASAQENNGDYWGRDDRGDNNSIVLTAGDNSTAVPRLHDTSQTPDICSASDLCPFFFMSSFTFPAAPVYLLLSRLSRSPGLQISLVEAAVCSVCFEYSHKRVVEYLLSYPPLLYMSALSLRQLGSMPVKKSCLCRACI